MRQADARIIPATNTPLDHMVREGRFLEDLLHRFGYFRLLLPPLAEERKRRGLDAVAKLAPEICQLLETAPWPMNVRGVKSIAEFVAVSAEAGHLVQLHHLPPGLLQECRTAEPARRILERRTRRLSQLLAALESAGGDLVAAARLLEIHPRTA